MNRTFVWILEFLKALSTYPTVLLGGEKIVFYQKIHLSYLASQVYAHNDVELLQCATMCQNTTFKSLLLLSVGHSMTEITNSIVPSNPSQGKENQQTEGQRRQKACPQSRLRENIYGGRSNF